MFQSFCCNIWHWKNIKINSLFTSNPSKSMKYDIIKNWQKFINIDAENWLSVMDRDDFYKISWNSLVKIVTWCGGHTQMMSIELFYTF